MLYVLYKEIHLPTTISDASESVGHADKQRNVLYSKRKLKG